MIIKVLAPKHTKRETLKGIREGFKVIDEAAKTPIKPAVYDALAIYPYSDGFIPDYAWTEAKECRRDGKPVYIWGPQGVEKMNFKKVNSLPRDETRHRDSMARSKRKKS